VTLLASLPGFTSNPLGNKKNSAKTTNDTEEEDHDWDSSDPKHITEEVIADYLAATPGASRGQAIEALAAIYVLIGTDPDGIEYWRQAAGGPNAPTAQDADKETPKHIR
jgi:hypothetical protein